MGTAQGLHSLYDNLYFSFILHQKNHSLLTAGKDVDEILVCTLDTKYGAEEVLQGWGKVTLETCKLAN